MKFLLFSLSLLCINPLTVMAQTSPVKWINNVYNINIDTTHSKNINYADVDFKFTFQNTGEHVTFVDTSVFHRNFIAKPAQTLNISFHLSTFLYGYSEILKKKQNISKSISLPFYYEGKTYREKIICDLTFGKSKLIKYDNPQIDVTDKIAQSVKNDVKNDPSIRFTHYFTIKNISTKPILCTKSFIAWNDAPYLKSYDNDYVEILPGGTYQIPAQINMDRKYRFNCTGRVEVFSADAREVFYCEIVSKYDREKQIR